AEFLRTEAFAFRARSEGMDVVYVEGAFFDDLAGNVLRGQANWTRILVHELSHLVCGTHDVNDGQSRYAWSGIGPHAGYPSAETIRNADNWAFFAADCAGALTAGQRATALRRT
ncbi:MAG TPA: M35 family metallo-endopeptidase, partial [Burkholderiaceae bacterium]